MRGDQLDADEHGTVEQSPSDEVLEHLFEAVACFDAQETLVRWNPPLRFLGDDDWLNSCPSFTQMALRVVDLLAVSEAAETRLWWELSASGVMRGSVPAELHLANGKVYLVKRSRTASGGQVWLFNDVTTLTKRGMALEQSNRDLEQFAYIASHDLQEPLRMVASFTQLLQKRYDQKLDIVGREYIQYAVDGSRRMQLLLEELLYFSRVNAEPQDIDPVSLYDVCADAIENLSGQIHEADAIVDVPEMLPVVPGNHSQLTQVFQNLIANAIKFNSGKPLITITALEREGLWVIQVNDNGIGLAGKHMEKIFKIFQRLQSRSEHAGNGIGLAICKKVVENHGGRIWVDSQENQGSTFNFTLPSMVNRTLAPNDATDESARQSQADETGYECSTR